MIGMINTIIQKGASDISPVLGLTSCESSAFPDGLLDFLVTAVVGTVAEVCFVGKVGAVGLTGPI